MGTYNAFCALSTKVVKEADDDGKQPGWEASNSVGSKAQEERSGSLTAQRKRQREADATTWKTSKRPAPNYATTSGNQTPDGRVPSESTSSRPRSGSHVRAEMDMEGDGDSRRLSFSGVATSTQPRGKAQRRQMSEEEEDEPLFLPEASQSFDEQMEVPASQVLRDAGLQDFERMTQVELRAMLEDDDGDVEGFDVGGGGEDVDMSDVVEKVQVEDGKGYYAPTQRSKEDDFRPLFDD